MRRRGVVAAIAAVSVSCLVAWPALAGKPTIVRETTDLTFSDPFLSDACGVPVMAHVTGHQTLRTFADGKGRLIEVFTINDRIVATSAYGTFRFRDVGADVTRVTKDGIVHQIIGQLPFWFNGTTWEDPVTGEVLKSPTGADLFEPMLEDACAALAP
jgi:hypothetical protein